MENIIIFFQILVINVDVDKIKIHLVNIQVFFFNEIYLKDFKKDNKIEIDH